VAAHIFVLGLCFFVVAIGVWMWGGSAAQAEVAEAQVDELESEAIETYDRISSVAVGQYEPDELPPWGQEQELLRETVPDAPGIYGTLLFDSCVDDVQRKMEATLNAAGRPIPTKSQWQMILSASRAANVIAGAGSGKSTSLSLRVVFMHKFLGIPLDQITVVTFTRASRADMVAKLIRDMGIFGVILSEDAARKVIRTFHSMVFVQAGSFSKKFFEQIGEGQGGLTTLIALEF